MSSIIDPSPDTIFEPSPLRLNEDSDSLAEVLQRAQAAFQSTSPRPSTLCTTAQTESTLSAISVLSATSDEIILRFHHHSPSTDTTPSFSTAPGPPVTRLPKEEGGSTRSMVLRLQSPAVPSPGVVPVPINPLLEAYSELAERFDPGARLGQIGDRMERAFWAVAMPAISKIMGAGQSVSSVFTSPATLLSNLAIMPNPKTASDTGELKVTEHLYAQETIYTLRLPPSAPAGCLDGNNSAPEKIDIGPTLQPVWVRKRAAIPDWTTAPADSSAWADDWRSGVTRSGHHRW